MRQFYMKRGEALNNERMGKILQEYQTQQLPILRKRYKYYTGQHDVLLRVPSDEGKPCNRIVCNFVKNIVETYEGYAVGVPVTYQSQEKSFEELMEVFRYNDYVDEDSELFRDGLIYGRGVEICYVDEDGKQRFKAGNPEEWIPVYEDSFNENLLYAIRFWQTDYVENTGAVYQVETYDATTRRIYKSYSGFSTFQFVEEMPHYFNQVPVTFFSLNKEEEGIADTIFSLQDAYNSLISDSIDDWDAFCDAYLIIKGAIADDDDLASMKVHRCLMLDAEDSAEYLTKNTSTTEIEHLLTTVEEKIREMSACPNFASETFGTSSGIAIKYRLMAMQNNVSAIWNNFRKALQKRIELLYCVERLKDTESSWRDVSISFTANMPQDVASIATEVNALRGLVSDRTLLGQIPFIADVDAELELIAAQKAENMALYSFGTDEEAEQDGEEEA